MIARYATEADLQQWYGPSGMPFSMRAAVLVDGDRVIAVGGIGWADGHMQLFCQVADEARPHKLALGRLAALVRGMIRGPVFALQDCTESTSARLLQWCGLTELDTGVWYGSGNPGCAYGRIDAPQPGRAAQATESR